MVGSSGAEGSGAGNGGVYYTCSSNDSNSSGSGVSGGRFAGVAAVAAVAAVIVELVLEKIVTIVLTIERTDAPYWTDG